MFSRRNQGLKVEVRRGVLTISIGVDALAFAHENSAFAEEVPLVVMHKVQFAKDVVTELKREEEDGTTPVHRLLDRACKMAHEAGSEAVQEYE